MDVLPRPEPGAFSEEGRDKGRPRGAADEQDRIERLWGLARVLECLRRAIEGRLDERPNQRFVLIARDLDVEVQRRAALGDDRLFADLHVRFRAQPLLRLLGGPPEPLSPGAR